MKKRLLAVLVCVIIMLTLLPTVALAAEYEGWDSSIEYSTGDTIKIDGVIYEYGGNYPTVGLDLARSTPIEDTVYKAGTGTVLLAPTIHSNTGDLTGVKLTLNGAQISLGASASPAFLLPGVPVEIELVGKSTITSPSRGFDAFSSCADITMTGSGTIEADTDGDLIYAYGKTVTFNGGTRSGIISAGSAVLNGVTIPQNGELNLQDVTGAFSAENTVNNGKLVLKENTSDEAVKALKLTGSGYVMVKGNTDDLYFTNDGVKLFKQNYLNFMASNSFNESATLEDDGYSYACVTNGGKKDYTIRLGNLVIESSYIAITLPDNGNVTLELVAGTTTHIKSIGNSSILFNWNGDFFTHTIKGGGKLVMQGTTAESGVISTINRLNITGGDITIYNDATNGIGLDAYFGYSQSGNDEVQTINITGGKLNITVKKAAIAARKDLVIGSNMQITKPEGAEIFRYTDTQIIGSEFVFDTIGVADNKPATSVVIEPGSAPANHPVTVYNHSQQSKATIWLTGSGLDSSDLLITKRNPSGSAYRALLKLADSDDVFATYNIYLRSGQKSTGSAMNLTFDLNAKYAGQDFTLVHRKADGTYEYFYDASDANGDLSFGPLYELSPFMLVKGRLTAGDNGSPVLGDNALPVLWLIIALAMAAAALAFLILYKRQRD